MNTILYIEAITRIIISITIYTYPQEVFNFVWPLDIYTEPIFTNENHMLSTIHSWFLPWYSIIDKSPLKENESRTQYGSNVSTRC
jgi:hypothetical protein